MSADPDCLIDPVHAAFLTAGVSISVGSRDAGYLPHLTRGIGCDVAGDHSRVRVFVVAEQSREVLDDIRANRHVAVVFSQPGTNRTVQLKGCDAVVESLADADSRIVERYREAFADELGALGYSDLFARALIDGTFGELVAVSFAPSGAFVQTPGPNAGAPVGDTR